jgi:hypothetical protein
LDNRDVPRRRKLPATQPVRCGLCNQTGLAPLGYALQPRDCEFGLRIKQALNKQNDENLRKLAQLVKPQAIPPQPQAEGEWPKYYATDNYVWKYESESDFGIAVNLTNGLTTQSACSPKDHTALKISATEAVARIAAAQKKDLPNPGTIATALEKARQESVGKEVLSVGQQPPQPDVSLGRRSMGYVFLDAFTQVMGENLVGCSGEQAQEIARVVIEEALRRVKNSYAFTSSQYNEAYRFHHKEGWNAHDSVMRKLVEKEGKK